MPFLEQLKPRWVVLENVGGMLKWDGFPAFRAALVREGYHLRVQRLDAADHGTPQNRKRVFVVGDRLAFPAPVRGLHAPVPARTIIDHDGDWKRSPLHRPGRARATLDRAAAGMKALGRGVDFLVVYYGSDKAGGWQTLDRPLRTLTTLDRFGLVQWDADGEPTLRMLQVPELKAAMGLPPAFRLDHGTRRDKVRLLGNGVAPPVMQAVVRSLAADALVGLAA